MTVRNLRKLLVLAVAAVPSGCGSPGPPVPPSLELARPVSNLRASRKGDKVTLTWSAPTKTTDQHNIRRGGMTAICRNLVIMKQCTQIAQVPYQKPSANKTPRTQLETYRDQLASPLELQNPQASLFYSVSVQNSYGRSAGLSNQVQVPAAPVVAPPSNLQAQVTADGVRLTWDAPASPPQIPGLRFVYRAYRTNVGTKSDAIAGELTMSSDRQPSLLDQGFEWEKTYDYRVTIVTFITQGDGSEQQVEGDDTPPVTVVAHDVFPPAPPTGLQAVFSGPGQKPFIDLVWTPNSEPDFAGYNIYRHEPGMAAVKINSELVKSPAFRDTDVAPGHTYSYSVSATDVRGNESQRSGEASETVP